MGIKVIAAIRPRVKLVFRDCYSEEVRCSSCKALLLKAARLHKSETRSLGVEVKCRRCGKMNQL